jgi:tetratricopeptide (TPR) repeat protein
VERTTKLYAHTASSLCCCLAVLVMATFGTLEAVEAAEEQREYDFDLAKGLYLYHQGQYREAERHLKEAFTAKPGDQTSGNYLGLTSLRLQRYREAEERFREVLRRHPDDARARLGLGMALYHQDRSREASTELTTAERTLKDDALLYYYAGLAAADQQAYEQASEKFMRAGKLDADLARDARYQRGATLHSQRQFQQATAEFRSAVEGGQAAQAKPTRPAASPASQLPSKRWSASYGLSLQYDSNVVLLPGGSALPNGISHKDDFVTALAGNAEYRFLQTDSWTIGAGGGLFTNLHARLSDFNVLDVAPTLYVERRLGSAQLRLQYTLDYVTVGGDAYLLSNALQPTLTIPESERTYTQAFFRYQNKDFKSFRDDELLAPVNQTRDANNYMLGAMQYWRLSNDRGYLRAGYTFDTDRTGGDASVVTPGVPTSADWQYTGHRLSTGAAYQPLAATTLLLAFDYYRQNYSNPNSFSPDGTVRKDNVYQLTGTAVRDLRSWLWLAFQYSFTRDQSNVDAFDYSRHIISLTVGGAF